jgi:hypothetical protein
MVSFFGLFFGLPQKIAVVKEGMESGHLLSMPD